MGHLQLKLCLPAAFLHSQMADEVEAMFSIVGIIAAELFTGKALLDVKSTLGLLALPCCRMALIRSASTLQHCEPIVFNCAEKWAQSASLLGKLELLDAPSHIRCTGHDNVAMQLSVVCPVCRQRLFSFRFAEMRPPKRLATF